MIDEITICGQPFKVPVPDRYAPGETIELTAGESSSISQTFCENIRNNIASKMKKLEGFDGRLADALVAEWQAKVDEYAAVYKFGVRAPGGGRGPSVDPETREALALIRPAIRKELVKKYGPKHGRSAEAVNEAAVRLLNSPKGERYRNTARQILRQKEDAATDLLDGLDLAAE
jgi:hypothetical protein